MEILIVFSGREVEASVLPITFNGLEVEPLVLTCTYIDKNPMHAISTMKTLRLRNLMARNKR
jgi:hypothetical protein